MCVCMCKNHRAIFTPQADAYACADHMLRLSLVVPVSRVCFAGASQMLSSATKARGASQIRRGSPEVTDCHAAASLLCLLRSYLLLLL